MLLEQDTCSEGPGMIASASMHAHIAAARPAPLLARASMRTRIACRLPPAACCLRVRMGWAGPGQTYRVLFMLVTLDNFDPVVVQTYRHHPSGQGLLHAVPSAPAALPSKP